MSRRPATDASDPRAQAIVDVVLRLAGPARTPVSVQDYIAHRREREPGLPAVTTVYRIFGSWPALLERAGLSAAERERRPRTDRADLIDALQAVAKALGLKVLSSHAYDEYRLRSQKPLPSSSVIRKWLGSWEEAVHAAGLEAPRRHGVRRVGPATCLEAIRQAVRALGPDPEPAAYERWCEEREAEGSQPPRLVQILLVFPSFEQALQAAEAERGDDLHPHALWTTEEARRIARNVKALLGGRIDQGGYEAIRDKASRPMPSWPTLCQLVEGLGAGDEAAEAA